MSRNALATTYGAKQKLWETEADIYGLSNIETSLENTATLKGAALPSIRFYMPAGFYGKFPKLHLKFSHGVKLVQYIWRGGYYLSSAKAGAPVGIMIPKGGGEHTIDLSNVEFIDRGNIFISATLIEDAPTGVLYSSMIDPGKILTLDPNYEAKFTYLAMGDSITWGTLGAIGGAGSSDAATLNSGSTHYSSRITASLRAAGIDVRHAKRGFGGAQSFNWVDAIKDGLLNDQQFDLVTIGLGTNDAGGGQANTGNNTYSANIQFIVNYLVGRNPKVNIILLAPPISDTSDRVPNLASFRTALQAVVATNVAMGRKVYYYDQTTGFPTGTITDGTTGNYVETGVGNHVHPRGDTGHVLIYNGLWAKVQLTDFYLTNKAA